MPCGMEYLPIEAASFCLQFFYTSFITCSNPIVMLFSVGTGSRKPIPASQNLFSTSLLLLIPFAKDLPCRFWWGRSFFLWKIQKLAMIFPPHVL